MNEPQMNADKNGSEKKPEPKPITCLLFRFFSSVPIRGQVVFLLLFILVVSCSRPTEKPPSVAKQVPVQSTGPVNYVALGDSTGAGVGARNGGYVARLFKRILQERPGSKLTNLCVSGATSFDVLHTQVSHAISAKPTLITLGIGINDIGHGVSPAEFAENFESIVSRLRAQTDAQLVIANIPDTSAAPALPQIIRPEIQRLIPLFNRHVDEIATRYGAAVVDVYTPTHELLPRHPEYFSPDGFHPSDAGYELWAERMWPAIAHAVGIAA
jgi:acyl-CoA thioesterase I